jgi:hypothetical protein
MTKFLLYYFLITFIGYSMKERIFQIAKYCVTKKFMLEQYKLSTNIFRKIFSLQILSGIMKKLSTTWLSLRLDFIITKSITKQLAIFFTQKFH